MTFKSEWLWYLMGALLLAIQGLINVDNRFYYFDLLGLGWLSFLWALRQGGPSRPGTAIALLLVTNLAFWLSYALWKLRPRIVGPVQTEGTDPFGMAVAVWLIAIVVCASYEAIVLLRGLKKFVASLFFPSFRFEMSRSIPCAFARTPCQQIFIEFLWELHPI